MAREIRITVDDTTHSDLKAWKNERGMTWAEVLFYGVGDDEHRLADAEPAEQDAPAPFGDSDE